MFPWDEGKRQRNWRKHRIDFADVERFDLVDALLFVDDRTDYGEAREIAIGFLDERIHVLVFTRRGDDVRVISLRKANEREIRQYDTRT